MKKKNIIYWWFNINIIISKFLTIIRLKKLLVNNIYRFSITDMVLYLIEKDMKCPHIQKNEMFDNPIFVKMNIGSSEIYWPKHFNASGLPWLYNEVFKGWNKNPSSYSHPNFKFNNYSWIIDAGVCEGFFSKLCLKNGAQKVIGIEPVSSLFESIQLTFKDEIEKLKFFPINSALGDKNGFIEIDVNIDSIWDSGYKSVNTNCEKVKLIKLDDLSRQLGLTENGLIKMDIEGAEMNALAGASDILKNYKPNLAIAVYHDYENAKLCKEIILKANPLYRIEFRGMYGYFIPPRPYLLFAF